MYIVSIDSHSECCTDYVVKTLDDVADLLLNEEFLEEYDWLFEEGITGFRWGEKGKHSEEVIVQYWDGFAYEETSLYLYEIKITGE